MTAAMQENGATLRTVGFLFDAKRCTGCAGCVLACREANGQEAAGPTSRLGENSFLAIQRRGGRFVRRSCMHCVDPACVSVCPVGAFRKQPDGAVTYKSDLCMGCRYCLLSCPFDAPRYQWSRLAPLVSKCELCPARRSGGELPACAAACPTGALRFGARENLIADAESRIAGGGYVERVYGEKEAGGTSVLYLSDVPFVDLGLPMGLPESPLPIRTRDYLGKLPGLVGIVTAGLAALHWIIGRRMRVAAALATPASSVGVHEEARA
jgi:formate dehydrogenase iron-sulfur subunit